MNLQNFWALVILNEFGRVHLPLLYGCKHVKQIYFYMLCVSWVGVCVFLFFIRILWLICITLSMLQLFFFFFFFEDSSINPTGKDGYREGHMSFLGARTATFYLSLYENWGWFWAYALFFVSKAYSNVKVQVGINKISKKNNNNKEGYFILG